MQKWRKFEIWIWHKIRAHAKRVRQSKMSRRRWHLRPKHLFLGRCWLSFQSCIKTFIRDTCNLPVTSSPSPSPNKMFGRADKIYIRMQRWMDSVLRLHCSPPEQHECCTEVEHGEGKGDDWNYNTPINWIWLWCAKWIFFLMFSFRAVGWYFDGRNVGRSTGNNARVHSIAWRKHSQYSRGPLMYLWFNSIWMAQRILFIVN